MHSAFLLHSPAARILLLIFAAFLGGFVNSIAGGGGFIAFPTLLKSGLLPIQANATTTVALWPGQFTSIAGYREELHRHLRLVIPIVVVALIGGFAGAWTLLHNSQDIAHALQAFQSKVENRSELSCPHGPLV